MSLSLKQELVSGLLIGVASVGLVLLIFAFKGGIGELPLCGDNQMYFYISERVASGCAPYVCHFDPKNALSMMFSGLIIFIGRIFGVSDVSSVRILSLCVIGGSAGLIWLITLRLTRSTRASLFAAASVFSFPGYLALASMGCRPKVFVVFFMLLTILFYGKRKPFWSAFSASLSFLCWQPGLLLLGFLFLGLIVQKRRRADLTHALTGALIPLVIYELYFVMTGTVGQQFEQAFYYTYRYMSASFRGFSSSLYRILIIWGKGFGYFNILLIAFPYGIIRYWTRVFRGRESLTDGTERDPRWFYFQLCMYGCLFFTYYSHQGFPDLFFVLPFIAIVSGWILDLSLKDISNLAGRRMLRFASVIITLLLFVPTVFWISSVRFPYTLSDQYRLAKEIDKYIAQGEPVYAMGCTHLLGFTHADNWLKHGFFSETVDDYLEERTNGEVFTPVKNGSWPSLILLSREHPRGSELWLESKYREITTPEYEKQHIKVFKKKEDLRDRR